MLETIGVTRDCVISKGTFRVGECVVRGELLSPVAGDDMTSMTGVLVTGAPPGISDSDAETLGGGVSGR